MRRLAGVSAWSVVSRLPSSVTGTLSPLTPCLSQLPTGALKTPTILVLQRLAGQWGCCLGGCKVWEFEMFRRNICTYHHVKMQFMIPSAGSITCLLCWVVVLRHVCLQMP